MNNVLILYIDINNSDGGTLKNKQFRDLKLNKSCLEGNSTFFNFKSPDIMRSCDSNYRTFENSIGQIPNQRFGQPPWGVIDSTKSNDYKFCFNSIFPNINTPTPIKQPDNGYNMDRSRFFAVQPSPMHHPLMQQSPTMNFGNMNKCFVFPPALPTGGIEDNQIKELVTFGSNDGNIPNVTRNNSPIKNDKSTKPTKTTKRKNLSIREDVMNKNIFRAFKRELKAMYMDYVGDKATSEDKEHAKAKFLQSSATFTDNIIQNSGVNLENFSNFNMDICKTYIGILLDYCQMKKIVKTNEDKERLSSTFNVIYAYSHQKFYEYLEIPEIKVIFRVIISKTGIEKFINHHDSLHKEKYTTHLNSLMEKL